MLVYECLLSWFVLFLCNPDVIVSAAFSARMLLKKTF